MSAPCLLFVRPSALSRSPRPSLSASLSLPLFRAFTSGSPRRRTQYPPPAVLPPPPKQHPFGRKKHILTLAIESSCDDTCVAVLLKETATGAARLCFNKKVTSDNRAFRGVHPLTAVKSHTAHLGPLIQEALRALPAVQGTGVGVSSTAADSPRPELEGEALRNGAGESGGGDLVGEGSSHRANGNNLLWVDGQARMKPDFVSVTRGPGMLSNLSTGLNTAKGLAIAWDVPLLGVNHMQAHALTPRLVDALEKGKALNPDTTAMASSTPIVTEEEPSPTFPFLSLLVSGGHTLLVHSRGLNDHAILVQPLNIAIGDMIDKCARLILPADYIKTQTAETHSVMYGPLLEKFAFPDVFDSGPGSAEEDKSDYAYQPPAKRADEILPFDAAPHGYDWTLTPPLSGHGSGREAARMFDFAGLNSQVQNIVLRRTTDSGTESAMPLPERRLLARETMRLIFEHLASRLLFALHNPSVNTDTTMTTVVVAGGVASNKFLRHILRATLDARGFGHVQVVCPPVALCTDNAAMIAWTGLEMYEAGWRTGMDVLAIRKWPLDSDADGGGILGAPGWRRVGLFGDEDVWEDDV
ncbi:Uu.00g019830.m01.CDS01 [Anthostomella pinea]|uniref:Uu.00g019830.m01.CDS01 n=1 Tax=Anthostomella pinea TaxID=933095 RepID=A0AAI8YQN6_9PEZI|nr:Uu.00g019830.m01.CDS01 [Anthostomella pinea]